MFANENCKKKKHMENGAHDLYIYIKVVWHLLSFNCSCNKRVKSTCPSHHLMFCLFSFGMRHGHLAPRIIQGSVSNLCQVLRWSFTSNSAKPECNTFTTMCTLWRQQHLYHCVYTVEAATPLIISFQRLLSCSTNEFI